MEKEKDDKGNEMNIYKDKENMEKERRDKNNEMNIHK